MTRRLRQDDGIALIVAIMVLTILLGIGLALIALADGQQGPARDERQRVASSTLAEAALTAQVFQLSRLPWPGTSAAAPASDCSSAAATPDSCPDAATIAANFSPSASPDFNPCPGQPSWSTWVRDNGPVTPANSPARTYYSTSGLTGMPAWDANGDGALWVGASGYTVGCKLRRFVTLVKANYTQISFPRNVITANWLQITGKKKAVVDTTGQHAQPKSIRPPKKQAAAQAAAVQVRCTPTLPAGVTDPCLVYTKNQVKPNTGAKVATIASQMLTAAQLAGFQQLATADGKYYPAGTCPTNLTGNPAGNNIVFVEDLTGCPAINVNGNDKNNPGFLVIKKGMLTLAGKATYYGFIYHANTAGVNTKLIYLTGSAVIQGAVSVDGLGGVNPATKHTAIIFDPRPLALPKVRTNAIAVPGTWRELDPGQ